METESRKCSFKKLKNLWTFMDIYPSLHLNCHHQILCSKFNLNDKFGMLMHIRPILHQYRNQVIDLQCKSTDWFLHEYNIGIIWFKEVSMNLFKRLRLNTNAKGSCCDKTIWESKGVLFFTKQQFVTTE